ncbi:MAG: SRPBCC domain-containing protein [Granulosicoccus sp.]|nr:SRPBCC domain-containing protein [Granulosicoccus sp.]
MSTTTINKSIFLNVPRETVWAYLTDKDKLGEWFHPAAADLVEGQPYALLGDAADSESKVCWGKVLKAQQPTFLSYTFTIKPLGNAVTTVNWTLEVAAGGTRVTLSHEGIGDAAGDAALGLLMALDGGWDKHFSRLREKAAA